MLCKGADAVRDDDHALIWRVTLTFSTNVDQDDAQNGQQQGDPTLWVPIRRLLYEVKEEVSDTDINGNVILNTANLPYDTGVLKRRYLPVWEFTQWEPLTVTDNDILDRMSVVNSASWPPSQPKPAKTWLCKVLDSVVGFYAGYRCRMTTYRLIYDSQDWTEKRPSVGWHYKTSTGKRPSISGQRPKNLRTAYQ